VIWKFHQPVPVSALSLHDYQQLRDCLQKQWGAMASEWWMTLPMGESDLLTANGPACAWKELLPADPFVEVLIAICRLGVLPSTFGGTSRPNCAASADLIAYARRDPRLMFATEHSVIQNFKRIVKATSAHSSQTRFLNFPPLRGCRLALQSICGPQDWDLTEEWQPMKIPPRRIAVSAK
jgi:hypothetical protein